MAACLSVLALQQTGNLSRMYHAHCSWDRLQVHEDPELDKMQGKDGCVDGSLTL